MPKLKQGQVELFKCDSLFFITYFYSSNWDVFRTKSL